MTMFEIIRRALMAGLGMQAKAKEFIDELVKQGELSETQGARLIREWSDKADKTGKDLSKSIVDLVGKPLEKMNIPTRDEVEKLQRKVQSLSARVKKLEEAMPSEETTEK